MVRKQIRTLHLVPSLERRGIETVAVLLTDRFRRDVFQPALWTIDPFLPGYLVPERTDVFLPRAGEKQGLLGLRRFKDLVRVMRGFRPRLVFCHGGRTVKYAVAAKPFAHGAAYVFIKSSSVHPWLDSPIRRRFHAMLLRHMDALVAVGEHVREEVEATFHPRRARLLTIPPGADLAPFATINHEIVAQVRTELSLSDTDVCLMTVGKLSWEKNPEYLISLLADLVPAHPHVKLVFVGTGPLESQLREQIKRAELEAHVQLLGLRNDVPRLLGAADIFVLPSLTEGLPGVLIEAGLAALPAVAFRVGSIEDILKDGKSGYVVPPGDAAAFKERTLQLIHDPVLRRTIGQAAQEICRAEFDIQRSVARYEALAWDLIAPGRQPGDISTAYEGSGDW